MSKALSLAGLIVAALIAVLMIVDLAWQRASVLMDIGFLICAIGLGILSYLTYKEQT